MLTNRQTNCRQNSISPPLSEVKLTVQTNTNESDLNGL